MCNNSQFPNDQHSMTILDWQWNLLHAPCNTIFEKYHSITFKGGGGEIKKFTCKGWWYYHLSLPHISFSVSVLPWIRGCHPLLPLLHWSLPSHVQVVTKKMNSHKCNLYSQSTVQMVTPSWQSTMIIHNDQIPTMFLYCNALFQLSNGNDSFSLSLFQQVTWWATTRHLDGTPHLQW